MLRDHEPGFGRARPSRTAGRAELTVQQRAKEHIGGLHLSPWRIRRIVRGMSEVTRILEGAQAGDPQAADQLLPLVYDELRKLAAHKMAQQPAGQTLQPTALVHEAWLRLVRGQDQTFENRQHFFAVAAQAMRRILIDKARRKERQRHGGHLNRVELDAVEIAVPLPDPDLLALDEALNRLAAFDPVAAELVNLRFFVGVGHAEAAQMLGLSRSSADRAWVFARAWLFQELQ
jgi:RNA polymerase sigma factor (TIGR02999 family)